MPPNRAKVLMVDDTPANLRLLYNMLSEQGYAPHAANSGTTALQFLETFTPDIVLLDVKMPDMDGYEVCRRIKANERTRDLPVIFVSSMDAAWDKVRAFSAGAVDYIVKPIEESELLVRLETHLSLRNLQQRLQQQVQEKTDELIRVKEVLYEKKQLLKAIIDSASAAIYVKDLEGCYVLVNQHFQNLFGADGADLRGLTDHEIFPADVADNVRAQDLRVVASGKPMESEEKLVVQGEPRTYVSVRSPLHNLHGEIYAVCGIATDITERVHEEETLRTLNSLLESRLAERLGTPPLEQ